MRIVWPFSDIEFNVPGIVIGGGDCPNTTLVWPDLEIDRGIESKIDSLDLVVN